MGSADKENQSNCNINSDCVLEDQSDVYNQSPYQKKTNYISETPETTQAGHSFESPVNISLFGTEEQDQEQEIGCKTPVLSEWKFSSSTKNLLTTGVSEYDTDTEREGDRNKDLVQCGGTTDLSFSESPTYHNASLSSPLEHTQEQQGRPSMASSSDSSLDFSPSHLNMSYDWSGGRAEGGKTPFTTDNSFISSPAHESSYTPSQARKEGKKIRSSVSDYTQRQPSSPPVKEMTTHVVTSPATPQLDGDLKTVRVREPLLMQSSATHSTTSTTTRTTAATATTSSSSFSPPLDRSQQMYSSELECHSPVAVTSENHDHQGQSHQCGDDYTSDNESTCSDPSTPELPQLSRSLAKYKVPFHRSVSKKSATKLKDHGKGQGKEEGGGTHVSAAGVVGKLLYAEDNEEEDVDEEEDGSDTELEIQEIATSTRLLLPRRTAAGGAAGGNKGWVPLVSAEEWTAAPSFLKMQVRMRICELESVKGRSLSYLQIIYTKSVLATTFFAVVNKEIMYTFLMDLVTIYISYHPFMLGVCGHSKCRIRTY